MAQQHPQMHTRTSVSGVRGPARERARADSFLRRRRASITMRLRASFSSSGEGQRASLYAREANSSYLLATCHFGHTQQPRPVLAAVPRGEVPAAGTGWGRTAGQQPAQICSGGTQRAPRNRANAVYTEYRPRAREHFLEPALGCRTRCRMH
jgi:hypothetical protein